MAIVSGDAQPVEIRNVTLGSVKQTVMSLAANGSGVTLFSNKDKRTVLCTSYNSKDLMNKNSLDWQCAKMTAVMCRTMNLNGVISGTTGKDVVYADAVKKAAKDKSIVFVIQPIKDKNYADMDVVICPAVVPVNGKLFGVLTDTIVKQTSVRYSRYRVDTQYCRKHPDSIARIVTHEVNVPAFVIMFSSDRCRDAVGVFNYLSDVIRDTNARVNMQHVSFR